ncbi:MFS transporter [Mitsuaria sp. GD03876]|uniref:MFS transporter n=1 Tax=Mitsuaria sp. GD03876 TaxID=2975399 RepID=UPI00244B4991|nr:MFS transporter [Mitsuaria sp. GD03876]MDH0864721.1 MFS transporter [Mitsuaria sp. GD03876]
MSESIKYPRLMPVGFGAGALGMSLAFGAVPLLFLFYLTEFAKVPPAVAGVLLATPKLADMVLDPWIGRRTDAVARRLGSRGALLALGMAALPLTLVLLFVPLQAVPLPLRIGLLGALLIAQSLLLTVYTVAHTAIAGDIADGIEGRSALMAARAVGQTLAGLTVSVAAPQLVAAFGANQRGYLGMAVVLALASLAALTLCWLSVRRVRISAGVETGKPEHLLRALGGTLRNRAFYCIAGILVLLGLSSTALLSALPYVNKHLLHVGPDNLSLLLTPLFLTVLLGVSSAPWIARRAPAPAILFGALVLALAGIAWLGIGPRSNVSIASGCALFGLASGVLTVMISTLAIESATQFSARGESLGLYLGILFSAEKLGQSLGGVVMGLGLDWVGPLQGEASPLSLSRLEALWIAAPAFTLAAALLLLLPLTARLRAQPA